MSTRTLKRKITRTRKRPTFELTAQHFKANGAVLWRGRSRFDGSPMVLIAVGLREPTKNIKTPHCVTVYGLRSDISPRENILEGARSTCGHCPIKKECYVHSWTLAAIYKEFTAGKYPDLPLEMLPQVMRTQGPAHKLRLGGYANPSVVGWREFGRLIPNLGVDWLSYEHDWRGAPAAWKSVSMASTESIRGTLAADSRGWRAFQVVPVGQGRATVKALRARGLQAVQCHFKKLPHDASELQKLQKMRNGINCYNCPTPCNGKNHLSPNPHVVVEVHGNPTILPSRNARLRVLNHS